MKNKSLGIHKDNVIGVNYELTLVESAKQLSTELKTVLSKLKIDYNKFNSSLDNNRDEQDVITNPPIEIYEYQNFFILNKKNGDTVVLDGFRRLLWYNSPSTPILVRIYKEEELTNQQILSLLINLNHFKFYANSSYHDRGFALLLKTVFDIDITTFRYAFDSYLSSGKTKNDYSGDYGNSGTKKNTTIKERIINPFFISDIKFLETISKTKYLCDKYFGAILYQKRLSSEKEFDVKQFIELADKNDVLKTLTESYQKVGTNNSARSQEIVNKILEIYNNLFTLMEGGKIEQSLAEKQKDCKDIVTKLKKDKSLTKVTGSQNIYN